MRRRILLLRPYLNEKIAGDGFSLGAFLSFVMFVGLIAVWLMTAAPMIKTLAGYLGIKTGGTVRSNGGVVVGRSSDVQIGAVTLSGTGDGVESEPVPTLAPTLVLTPTATPAPTPTPLPVVDYEPTPTPGGSPLVVFGEREFHALAYSYYYPPFGPPNCSVANWKGDYCRDTTAIGEPWSKWLGFAVALGPGFLQSSSCTLGGWLYVHKPVELRGRYRIVDTCGQCDNKDDRPWIDFLDNRKRVDWGYPVLLECQGGDQ